MTDAPALSYPWQYPVALQFLVTGELDGTTPSPEFAIPPDPNAVLDPDSQAVLVGPLDGGIHVVENLGLIDLTGGGSGNGRADRFVRSFTIVGPTPVGVGVTADIGLAFDGISDPNGRITIPTGSNGLDSLNCIFVPQSAQLQVRGLTATPGNPVLVMLLVWVPYTAEELARMAEVCCCRAAAIDAEGEPFFTTALYLGANCTRTVVSALPNSAARGVGPTAVVVGGTGFTDGDQIFFIHESGTGMINVITSAVITPNVINVAIDVDGAVPLGDYNIVVAPPLAPPECQGIGEGLFTVT